MRASKLIIKSNAQKEMAKSGFGCRFHDLNYFELKWFFFPPHSLNSLYTQVIVKKFCRKS